MKKINRNPPAECCYLATWALWKAERGRNRSFFFYVHVQKMSKPKVIASETGQKGQNAEGNIE